MCNVGINGRALYNGQHWTPLKDSSPETKFSTLVSKGYKLFLELVIQSQLAAVVGCQANTSLHICLTCICICIVKYLHTKLKDWLTYLLQDMEKI